MKPSIITRLQELPEDVAPEVNWYLQDARQTLLSLRATSHMQA